MQLFWFSLLVRLGFFKVRCGNTAWGRLGESCFSENGENWNPTFNYGDGVGMGTVAIGMGWGRGQSDGDGDFKKLVRMQLSTTHRAGQIAIRSQPILTWWARQIKSRSCRLRNLLTTSAPNVNETPRSFSPHPWTSLSGSDHSKSHSKPENQKHLKVNWPQI